VCVCFKTVLQVFGVEFWKKKKMIFFSKSVFFQV
jgi:hypothetical protein